MYFPDMNFREHDGLRCCDLNVYMDMVPGRSYNIISQEVNLSNKITCNRLFDESDGICVDGMVDIV